MAIDPHIELPTIPESEYNHRQIIEDHVVDVLSGEFGSNIRVQKYYETDNRGLFEDCKNMIQSGVPNWLIRTRRVDTDDINPVELVDAKTARLEVLSVVPVSVEKGVYNTGRYVYVMDVLCRELLRKKDNRIKLPHNTAKPFVYLGNRDIFRDKEMDILLSEYNIEYVGF